MAPRGSKHLRRDVHAVGHNAEADPGGDEPFNAAAASLGTHIHQIGDLELADDLHARGVKVIVKPRKRQPGTRNLPGGDLHAVIVHRAVDNRKMMLADDGIQTDGIGLSHERSSETR